MPKRNSGNEMKQLDIIQSSTELYEKLLTYADEVKNEIQLLTQKRKELYMKLKEKEFVRFEMESNKINNTILFSPIISKENDTSVIDNEINQLNELLEQLDKEEDKLQDRCQVYMQASQCIDKFTEDINKREKENKEVPKRKKIDIGINILQAQESERQRIARDLHDSTVQNLTGLVHKTELCKKLIDIDVIRAKLELITMSNTIKSLINEMRDIIYDLKPMSLEDLGLIATVERYAKQIRNNHGLRVNIRYNNEEKSVLSVINLTLFRVIQEACHNIVKHAKATTIDIDINYKENEIVVTIKDNGIGFNLEKHNESSICNETKFGLSIMRERIYLLSGQIIIQSENNTGTIIVVSVPLTKCEGEKNE